MIKVINNTDYPTREVARLTRKALSYLDITHGVTVTVHYRKRTDADPRGRHVAGWYRNYWYPSRGEHGPQIRTGLSRPDVAPAPYHPYTRKGESGQVFDLADWREQLVAIVAHEGMHHRQGRRRNGDGGFREVDCDLAAYRAVGYLREDEKRAA